MEIKAACTPPGVGNSDSSVSSHPQTSVLEGLPLSPAPVPLPTTPAPQHTHIFACKVWGLRIFSLMQRWTL